MNRGLAEDIASTLRRNGFVGYDNDMKATKRGPEPKTRTIARSCETPMQEFADLSQYLGVPDLSQYKSSVDSYIDAHQLAIEANNNAARGEADWGLIAKGRNAMPYALSLLRQDNCAARSDGASILGWIGKFVDDEDRDVIVASLVEAIDLELPRSGSEGRPERETLNAMIQSLDQIGSMRAVPILSRILYDTQIDGSTNWLTILAIGDLVGQPLLDGDDPGGAVRQWLRDHGYGPGTSERII